MTNKRGQSIAITPDPDFNSLRFEGLAEVGRPNGADDKIIAKQFDALGTQFGGYADKAAKIEGKADGKVAGLEPDFRPNRATTLYGAAYDEAGQDTYLNTLGTRLHNDINGIYDEFSRLPVAEQTPSAFNQRVKALRGSYSKDVFPEIQGDFNTRFDKLSLSYQMAVQKEDASRRTDAARASMLSQVNASETTIARVALRDPNLPENAAAINEARLQARGAITARVQAGDLSAVQGEKMLQDLETRNALARQRGALAQFRSPQQAQEYRKTLDKDFMEGRLQIDADTHRALQGEAESVERRLTVQGNAQTKSYAGRLDDLLGRLQDGHQPSPQEWNTLREEATTTPNGEALYQNAQRRALLLTSMKGARPEDILDAAAQLRDQGMKQVGGIPAPLSEQIKFMEDYAYKQNAALAKDPLGFSNRQGLVRITPLAFEDQNLPAHMIERVAQAEAIAQSNNRAVRYLMPTEVDALSATLDRGGAPALNALKAIVSGARGRAPAILAEIGEKNAVLAQAGALLNAGGSEQAVKDLLNARRLKMDVGNLPEVDRALKSKAEKDILSGALLNTPDEQLRLTQAASAVAQVRLQRQGVDAKDRNASEIYKQALQEVAGRTMVNGEAYGGFATIKDRGTGAIWDSRVGVRVPTTVNAGRFQEGMESLTSKDWEKLGVPKEFASDIGRRATPIFMRDGYAFSTGVRDDKRAYIAREGKPVIVKWDQLEPILRQRSPDIFLGSSKKQ